jgi:hypothetical protein
MKLQTPGRSYCAANRVENKQRITPVQKNLQPEIGLLGSFRTCVLGEPGDSYPIGLLPWECCEDRTRGIPGSRCSHQEGTTAVPQSACWVRSGSLRRSLEMLALCRGVRFETAGVQDLHTRRFLGFTHSTTTRHHQCECTAAAWVAGAIIVGVLGSFRIFAQFTGISGVTSRNSPTG